MKEVYVVNCCRTAVGSFGGSLKDTPATELGAVVVKEALNRAGVKPEQVDELMFGCVLTAALGQNPARQVGVKAGLPYSVPAYTVGMVCGSGMKSVIEGARAILCGDADIIVAGGTENMSAAPYALPAERWGARMGDKKVVDTMIKDGLWDAYNNYHMGTTAENICDVWGITREELDAFGAASQQKTEAAQKAGRFDDEIVPVMVKKKKEMVEFKVDEFPRAGTTVESLGKLKGAFPVGPEGVEDEIVHTFEPTQVHADDAHKHVQRVTAGQASGINDGAAAIVLASKEAVEKYGLKPMAKLVSWGHGGVDPKIMGVGPVPASRQAMSKAGLKIEDIDLVEANEAFAAQSIAVARELGFDMEKVNVNGGAIAIGHPVGCSGARIIVTLLHEMAKRPDAKKGLATLCIGGGMGTGPNGEEFYGVAKLVHNHQVKHVIATHVGMTPDVGTQGMVDKTLTVDLIPQGTLAEMIRAGGAGLGGVLTPTGVGTIVEDSPFCLGKQTIDGRDYLLMKPIRADFALINGYLVDKFGNIWYKGTTRNFNIVMATAADVVIAEADNVVEIGDIQPENVVTSGAFVNYIVDGGNA